MIVIYTIAALNLLWLQEGKKLWLIQEADYTTVQRIKLTF
jgi:hypothetical protein